MEILSRDGKVLVRLDERQYRGSCVNLMNRKLNGAVFDGLILEGAYFAGAKLHNASFVRCDLYWANFFEARAVKADFRGAKLRGACLEGANLQQACFDEADLGRDALNCRTNLRGDDMAGASFVRTKLEGAAYDLRTRFPAGFDPKQHGMKLRTA
ncbi:MAG TPA: pentapeptide repeat-containing protein [Planctomycetaceae bacterium]|jgi:uncharacterized protein YjbI with pentapeptide repeats|nr:pentapeptide repeat-containing protein [Planctomycetaceae bacterium]